MTNSANKPPKHAARFEENNDKYYGEGILHAKELRNNLQIYEYNSAEPKSGDTIIFNEMVAGEQMEWKNNSKTDFGLYVFPELLNQQGEYTKLSLIDSQKKFWVNEDLGIKTDPKDGKPAAPDDMHTKGLFSESDSDSDSDSRSSQGSSGSDSDEDSDEGSNSEGYTSVEESDSDDEDDFKPYWEERVDLFKPAGVGDNETGVNQYPGTSKEVKDANKRIEEGVKQKYNWAELQKTDENLLRVVPSKAGDLYARRPSLGKVVIDVMVKEIIHLLENGYSVNDLPTFEFYFTSCSPANGPMGKRRILYKNPQYDNNLKSVKKSGKKKKNKRSNREIVSVTATENEYYNYFVHLVSRLKIYNDGKQRYKEYETVTRQDKNNFKKDYKPQPVYFETPFNVQDTEERIQLYTDYDQILRFFIPRPISDQVKQKSVQDERGETEQKFNQTIEEALNQNSINDNEIKETLNSIIQEIGNENIHNGKSDNEKLLWYMTKSFTHGTNDGGIIKEYFEEDGTNPRREIIKKIEAILSRRHDNKLKLYEYLMNAVGEPESVRYWITKTIDETPNINKEALFKIVKANIGTRKISDEDINKEIEKFTSSSSSRTGPSSTKKGQNNAKLKEQTGGKKKKRKRTRRKRKKKRKRTRRKRNCKKRMKKKIVCISSYNGKATRKLIKVTKKLGKTKGIRLSRCSKKRIKKWGKKKKRTRKKRN